MFNLTFSLTTWPWRGAVFFHYLRPQCFRYSYDLTIRLFVHNQERISGVFFQKIQDEIFLGTIFDICFSTAFRQSLWYDDIDLNILAKAEDDVTDEAEFFLERTVVGIVDVVGWNIYSWKQQEFYFFLNFTLVKIACNFVLLWKLEGLVMKKWYNLSENFYNLVMAESFSKIP